MKSVIRKHSYKGTYERTRGTKTRERKTHIYRGTSGFVQRFIVESTDRALKISF